MKCLYGEALTVEDVYINGWQRKSVKRKKLEKENQTDRLQSGKKKKVQNRVGPRDEEKFVYPQTVVAPTQTVSRRKSRILMVRKEPQVQRLKIFVLV